MSHLGDPGQWTRPPNGGGLYLPDNSPINSWRWKPTPGPWVIERPTTSLEDIIYTLDLASMYPMTRAILTDGWIGEEAKKLMPAKLPDPYLEMFL
jgi:hypothetical protein